ncbi:MAG: CotH kinase family protein [Oscillospiraceae bacterium]|nr:CotH kinase family protein [Oscillospiraceae bacterium]
MKYRLIGAVAIIFAAVLVLGASIYQANMEENVRVHQHLAAEKKEPCSLDHSDGTLCTHLPLIVIETGGKTIPGLPVEEEDIFKEKQYTMASDGDSMVTVHLDVFDSATNYNHPTDEPTISTATQIRVRGHSSREFGKAPYLLKLITDEGAERDAAMLGMSEHNEWALHGPFLDKSLIRNYLFYNLSGEMMDYAPNCRFCELILDGDYKGIYLLVETITAGEDGRLPIIKKKKNSLLAGYLLRIDRPTEADLETLRDVDVYTERTYIQHMDVAIRYPGKGRLTEALKKRIEKDFSAFEKAMYSYDYDSGDYSYKTYIDVDSFVDYYIINSVSSNMDAGRFSTYLYKTIDGKYKLCVWDFNNCCNNFVDDETGADFDGVRSAVYFNMLFRNREFVERVISRYRDLRKTLLSEEYLRRYIDETLAYLGEAIDRNNVRWAKDIAADMLLDPNNNGRNPHSQKEAVEMLEDNLFSRLNWMDENIDYLLQFCAGSANKKFSELPH